MWAVLLENRLAEFVVPNFYFVAFSSTQGSSARIETCPQQSAFEATSHEAFLLVSELDSGTSDHIRCFNYYSKPLLQDPCGINGHCFQSVNLAFDFSAKLYSLAV